MNWKLIFGLSLFGLAMAFGSVYFIPESIEWAFWIAVLLISAYVIAKNAPGKYFLHGFLVCIVNCVWVTIVHISFYDTYVQNHPQWVEMMAKGPLSQHPKRWMAVSGPVAGIVSGIVLGLLSLLFARLMKRRTQAV